MENPIQEQEKSLRKCLVAKVKEKGINIFRNVISTKQQTIISWYGLGFVLSFFLLWKHANEINASSLVLRS